MSIVGKTMKTLVCLLAATSLVGGREASAGQLTMMELVGGPDGSDPAWFVEFDDHAYFMAAAKLWKHDGAAATQITGDYTFGTPYPLAVGNTLYFSGDHTTGSGKLWTHTAGTSSAVLQPVAMGTSIYYKAMVGDRLYFAASSGSSRRLYYIENGVQADPLGNTSLNPSWLFSYGGQLYLRGVSSSTSQLLSVDASSSTFTPHPYNNKPLRAPLDFVNIDGEMYFSAGSDDHGEEIWKMTANGTITKESDVGSSMNVRQPIAFRGDVYFAANNGDNWQLWKTGSVSPIADISVFSSSADPAYLPYFAILHDELYFAGEREGLGRELWKFDGETITLVADLREGAEGSNPMHLTTINDVLYFSADDGIHGREVWMLQLPEPSAGLLLLAGGGMLARRTQSPRR